MGRIVLVHGAWHGGWCWEQVVPRLRSLGHQVLVTELHRGSLAQDTAAVQADVDAIGGDAVVCGHSYGGCVITGLRAEGIRRLVYLAAMMPGADESASSLSTLGPSTGLSTALVVADDGTCTVEPGQADDVFYHDCPPGARDAARARLRSQVLATFAAPPGRVAWQEVDSLYVRCLEDRAVHPDLQDRLAERAGARIEWPTSHSPFLSRPELVADLLDRAAS